MICYESPRRILRMLLDIKEILGDRKVVVLRELTKVYEEILHDDIGNVIAELEGRELVGEFTLIVEGKENNREPATLGPEIIKKIEEGLKNKEKGVKGLAIALSNEYQLNYRAVYRKILDLKREKYHR